MRTSALIRRICMEMFRDKRTLALLFLAPLLVLTLMYFFFNGETEEPALGVTSAANDLIPSLEEADINIVEYNQVTDPAKTVAEDDLQGLLQVENGEFNLTLQNSDPTAAQGLLMKVKQTTAMQLQARMAEQNASRSGQQQPDFTADYVYGSSETAFFDVLSPILIGFFVFFFVFLISGIGLLKERTTGTLDRLMATPIKREEIVTAYLIGYGIFAIIQTIIVVSYSVVILDVVLVGSIWNVLLINLLLALVALSLGTLLSTFASSEFQMVQFIPVVVIPQVFFSGIIPMEGMADWLQGLAKIMPLYYGAEALKGIMYKGLPLSEMTVNILALAGFAAVFITLNIFALKKYRRL
ncbi:ABC transporter permease [Sediminibacillus massiliensis]|uniref:ABC transporter permease n=1 Tax=Sediminibacillus massiliensis TaxID=1926277 RepID=UPI0009887795|nr:ABC transporter permease [Sediminibacillus massiliensis]